MPSVDQKTGSKSKPPKAIWSKKVKSFSIRKKTVSVDIKELRRSLKHAHQFSLPPHRFPQYLSCTYAFISHCLPPFWGFGESHLRTRLCFPMPQVKLHSDQSPHSPKPPSTKGNKGNLIEWMQLTILSVFKINHMCNSTLFFTTFASMYIAFPLKPIEVRGFWVSRVTKSGKMTKGGLGRRDKPHSIVLLDWLKNHAILAHSKGFFAFYNTPFIQIRFNCVASTFLLFSLLTLC